MAERKGLAVVDDDKDIGAMVDEYVRAQNLLNQIFVQAFLSGESFLNFLTANPSDITLVIMDGHLGTKPNGVQTAILAREINPQLPIVACTGHDKYVRDFARIHPAMIIDKVHLDTMLPCIIGLVLNS